jgi:multimeric flavodoxin WrbA
MAKKRVLGINGSPRKDGNTAILIRTVFAELEAEGIETELVQLSGHPVRGCLGCGKCYERKDGRCVIETDILNDLIPKMRACDGLVLGSPTYFTDVTSEMKALIDRAGYVLGSLGRPLRHRPGAAVTAVRRGGATHAFDTLCHFLHYNQMFLVGSSYWNMGYGLRIGEVEQDEEGMETMRNLGRNMAWFLKNLREQP